MSGRPKAKPPKRDNGTGSVRWSPRHQAWRIVVSLGDGKRKDRIFRGTESEAHNELTTMLVQLGLHTDLPPTTLTVADLVDKWVSLRTPAWSEVYAHNAAKFAVRLRRDRLGAVPARKLTVERVEMWLTEQAETKAGGTVQTYRSYLSTAFNWGVGRNLAAANPVDLAELPALRPRVEKRWLSMEEARRLIDAAKSDRWGALVIVSAMLGLRPGEALALRRESVDFEAGTISINRALKRTRVVVGIGETKNRQTRKVRATPDLLAVLRRQIEAVDMAREVYAEEWPTEFGNLIFVHQSNYYNGRAGQPPGTDHVSRTVVRCCRAAGVPELTPYELRHACASILLHRGMEPARVALMLGTSIQMLRLHYEHLLDPVQHEAAEVWGDILS